MNDPIKMRYAKDYIDKLANGVNPLTGEAVPENDTINNIHISRCLFYVSGLLNQLINNDGEITGGRSSGRKKPFSLTREQHSALIPEDNKMTISEIVKILNDIADENNMKHLKASDFTSWLLEVGVLEKCPQENGKIYRLPTEQGKQLGLFVAEKNGSSGMYKVVLYDSSAQQFIFDNIGAVITMKYSGN